MSNRKPPDPSDNTKGWQPELDDLRQREALARELGGADKVERQRAGGRLTVRERIDAARRHGKLPRDRLGRGQRAIRPRQQAQSVHAIEPRDGPRHDRRPAGRHHGR